MSRIGRIPVKVPPGVELEIANHTLRVKGPLGELVQTFHPSVELEFDTQGRQLRLKAEGKALLGLSRSLAQNAVEGVTKGFSKELEIVGLGYSAKLQGKNLVLALGYNQPVQLQVPEGIKVEVSQATNPARFAIKGVDKQLVGHFATTIRALRPVEPYKGKGIRYRDEVVRRKAGKAFVAGGQ